MSLISSLHSGILSITLPIPAYLVFSHIDQNPTIYGTSVKMHLPLKSLLLPDK